MSALDQNGVDQDTSAAAERKQINSTFEVLKHGVIILRNGVLESTQDGILRRCFSYADPAELEVNDGVYSALFTFNWPNNTFDVTKSEAKVCFNQFIDFLLLMYLQ